MESHLPIPAPLYLWAVTLKGIVYAHFYRTGREIKLKISQFPEITLKSSSCKWELFLLGLCFFLFFSLSFLFSLLSSSSLPFFLFFFLSFPFLFIATPAAYGRSCASSWIRAAVASLHSHGSAGSRLHLPGAFLCSQKHVSKFFIQPPASGGVAFMKAPALSPPIITTVARVKHMFSNQRWMFVPLVCGPASLCGEWGGGVMGHNLLAWMIERGNSRWWWTLSPIL